MCTLSVTIVHFETLLLHEKWNCRRQIETNRMSYHEFYVLRIKFLKIEKENDDENNQPTNHSFLNTFYSWLCGYDVAHNSLFPDNLYIVSL